MIPRLLLPLAVLPLAACAQETLPQQAEASQTQSVAAVASPASDAGPASNALPPFALADDAELVYCLLDGGSKPTGELRQRVVRLAEAEREESKKRVVPERTALIKSGLYDKKNVLVRLQDLTFRARRDTSFTDGLAELDPDMLRSFRDRKFAYRTTPLAWPNQPTVGSTLPDGGVTVQVSSSVVDIAKVGTTLRKRRVAGGPQPLTTPAGTFQCYQVEAERENATVPRPDMAMRSTARQVDYYAPGVGVVRTEVYGKNGKLLEVRELTARRTAAPPLGAK